MNENEYRAQVAIGTIDYRKAAMDTKNKKVLARIIEDTQDSDARAAVALNAKTDVRTLTRIIVDKDTDDYIIDLCIMHPEVSEHILKVWFEKEYMQTRSILRYKLHGMQAARGVKFDDRVSLSPGKPAFTGFSHPRKKYVQNANLKQNNTGTWIDSRAPYTLSLPYTCSSGTSSSVTHYDVYKIGEEDKPATSADIKAIKDMMNKGLRYESVTEENASNKAGTADE